MVIYVLERNKRQFTAKTWYPTFNALISASGEVDIEGNVTFTCQLDSGTPGTCTSPKTYTGLSTGQHTFSVFATDLAGNVGATVKWNWSIQGFGSPRKLG